MYLTNMHSHSKEAELYRPTGLLFQIPDSLQPSASRSQENVGQHP